jgi:hypothetical protein
VCAKMIAMRSPRRILTFALGLTLLGFAATAGAGSGGRATPPPTVAVDTSSVLAPTDAGYSEAMALADLLQRSGIRIAGVRRSKFAGFLGQPRAASFSSDRGAFAVVFFPEPDGAERVTYEVKRHRARYRYTYHWSEAGSAHAYHEDCDAPQRYLQVGPWFILTWTDSTFSVLQETLAMPRHGVG